MYAKGLRPDQVTYNTIIQSFCKARNLENAFRLHTEMLARDLVPTPVTYNLLINGLCVYGELADADSLLISLQDRNVNLTKVAYTTIPHCAKGDVQRAIFYFGQMMEKRFEISIRDYSAVINRLCKRSLLTEVKFFFLMMLYDGIYPDHQICEAMLNAFHEGGDLQSYFQLLGKMIKFGLLLD